MQSISKKQNFKIQIYNTVTIKTKHKFKAPEQNSNKFLSQILREADQAEIL